MIFPLLSGHLIREARLRAGISQAELARRLRTSQAAIGRWEKGRTVPSFEATRRAVRACGLDLYFSMANFDGSYAMHIEDQLRLTPAQRVDWLEDMLEQAAIFRNAKRLA